MRTKTLRILKVSASGRRNGSITRELSTDLIAALEDRFGSVQLTRRNLAHRAPFVGEAWINMIARARSTFRYTENGPVGLLKGKKAHLVVATGGVPVGRAMDFATPWLSLALLRWK